MTTSIIFFIILSVVIAAGLSYFQYYYNNKSTSKVTFILALLRTVSVFGILLLLINPIITQKTFEIQKTPLPVVLDNSSSIKNLNVDKKTLELYQKITSNRALQEKYEVQTYRFDSDVQLSDSFNFKGKETHIDKVAKSLKNNYNSTSYPIILITDGNQTSGEDYVYRFDSNNKVFPIVVGDTTTFLDLKINRLNVNKYAFYKNKFPVEVFLQYTGTKKVNADFKISQGSTILAKQTVAFSPKSKSAILNLLLPADKVGLQVFKANLISKESEINTYNNTKNFAVEVMDQKTTIAIISEINHPDIGALKRSIETNAQRKVIIVRPKDIKSLKDYDVLILYQPTLGFKTIMEQNKLVGINTFIITGTSTDFTYLNQLQTHFVFKMSNQKEDYLANFNSQFNLFAPSDIGFNQFPPLQNSFGSIQVNSNVSVLLSSRIRNVDTGMPLLSFTENQGSRAAYLFGENSWKWRMQNHIDQNTFDKYDGFIDKIIQFLATHATKKSLIVNHEHFYNSGDALEITAEYFNKNYELDEKALLSLAIVNKNTKEEKKFDFLKTNNAFKVNLDGLAPGQYQFTVREKNSNTQYSSYFEVLDFDIEKQFVNPDVLRLKQLATQTLGQIIYPNQIDLLIKKLIEDPNYKSIQKTITKKSPLLDWVGLFIIICSCLTAEWFVRKYHGML